MNFDKLTDYLNSLEKQYGIPACDCAVYYKHDNIYRHSAGFSDYEKTMPVSKNDLYFMYSATKVITITSVMQLFERGKLKLDDLLETYLPEFSDMKVLESYDLNKFPPERLAPDARKSPAVNKIKIIDLLTMTAGMSYDTMAPEIAEVKITKGNQASTRDIIAGIAKMPLIYEPGTHWAYSLAHDVLAAVVEVVSGQKFSEYLSENIFEPLGIKEMYFTLDSDRERRLSAQYAADWDTKTISPVKKTNLFVLSKNYESGGAGIICTVDAYGTFTDALCNDGVGITGKRILTRDSIDLIRTNYTHGILLEDFKKTQKVGYGYGLGVRTLIDKAASKSPVGEFGWDGAAGAYVLIDPVNHLSIFYAQHILRFPDVYFEIHPVIRDLTYEALNL